MLRSPPSPVPVPPCIPPPPPPPALPARPCSAPGLHSQKEQSCLVHTPVAVGEPLGAVCGASICSTLSMRPLLMGADCERDGACCIYHALLLLGDRVRAPAIHVAGAAGWLFCQSATNHTLHLPPSPGSLLALGGCGALSRPFQLPGLPPFQLPQFQLPKDFKLPTPDQVGAPDCITRRSLQAAAACTEAQLPRRGHHAAASLVCAPANCDQCRLWAVGAGAWCWRFSLRSRAS